MIPNTPLSSQEVGQVLISSQYDVTIIFTAPTYTLEEQIDHKLYLLEKLVPTTTQVTLIGHSIGCKIIMEIFKRNETHQIKGMGWKI